MPVNWRGGPPAPQGTFVDRDLNPAVNILKCYQLAAQGLPRPAALRRGPHLVPVPQRAGKAITVR